MRLRDSDDLRPSLDIAMSILRGLDSGNRTIMRCRDILERLIANFDAKGMLTHILTITIRNEERWLIK
jgi:hypothetical protein